MRRKHEMVNGHPISCWDDGDRVCDRYTVVYLDTHDPDTGRVQYLGMSAQPFHPQGFGQHGEMQSYHVDYRGRGGAFDKRIKFADLPPDCQRAVLQDLEPLPEVATCG